MSGWWMRYPAAVWRRRRCRELEGQIVIDVGGVVFGGEPAVWVFRVMPMLDNVGDYKGRYDDQQDGCSGDEIGQGRPVEKAEKGHV